LLHSNLYVSLCVIALCYSTDCVLGANSEHIYPFIFFATLFTYNFQRLVRLHDYKQTIMQAFWKKKNKFFMLLLTIFSALATIYFTSNFTLNILIYLIPASMISLLYPLPVIKISGKWMSLRDVPFAKIFLIAFVWSSITVGFVIEEASISWDWNLVVLFVQRFCFVLAITIPFDIRDLKYDSPKLKTIPSLVGEVGAKKVAIGSMIVFELIAVVQFFSDFISLKTLIALLLTSLISALLIMNSSSNKNDFYYSFWMESASLSMGLFLYLSAIYL
jgi:hypothetical protein